MLIAQNIKRLEMQNCDTILKLCSHMSKCNHAHTQHMPAASPANAQCLEAAALSALIVLHSHTNN